MNRSTRIGLLLVSGILDALGFIGFGLFPLTWIAKVPALLAVSDLAPKRAFFFGLIYGVAGHLGGYFWLGETLVRFSKLPIAVSVFLTVLVAAAFGVSFALLMGCVQRARRDLGIAPVWTLMVAYPALEFVFPNFLPYNIGASQYRFTAITQIVEVTGLLGLTALIGLVNGAVYELVEARMERRRVVALRWAVPVAAFFLVLGYGLIRIGQVDVEIAAARRITVGLVQTNHRAGDKRSRPEEVVGRHQEMTREMIGRQPGIDLVVWPETVLFSEARDLGRIQDTLAPLRPMVTGTMIRETHGQFFNSALAIDPEGGLVGRFDKTRLIPFSERIPLVDIFPQLRRLHPTGVMVERGTEFANLEVAGVTLLPMICYEDIMPGFVREMWRRAGPTGLLLNVSNDSWFGDSHEPLMHLALASFRSIETRRALLRSTGAGISAFVDPVGRIVSRTGQWREEVLVGEVAVIEGGATTPYLRNGELVGWICLGLTAFGLVVSLPRRRRGGGRGNT